MTKKEFIAIGQCYGLLLQLKGSDTIIPTESITLYNNDFKPAEYESLDTMYIDYDNAIPIIRDMASLTRECVQSDYNDGKPFIPILELHNILKNGDFILILQGNVKFEQLPFYITHQLLKWHFYPNIPEDVGVILVTDSFNPYK